MCHAYPECSLHARNKNLLFASQNILYLTWYIFLSRPLRRVSQVALAVAVLRDLPPLGGMCARFPHRHLTSYVVFFCFWTHYDALCSACGFASHSYRQGCEFESRSSQFSFLLLVREIYARASEHSRSHGCPFVRCGRTSRDVVLSGRCAHYSIL